MKTMFCILTAFFALNVSYANVPDNPFFPTAKTSGMTTTEILYLEMLKPALPSEAVFSDNIPEPKSPEARLVPKPPKTATFDEPNDIAEAERITNLMQDLSPVTPKEAPFTDGPAKNQPRMNNLAPSVPKYASFGKELSAM